MRNFLLFVGFFLVYCFFAEANVGKEIFDQKCSSCHMNFDDRVKTPFLFGQEKRYLLQALNDFKTDKRQDTVMGVMGPIAKGLTENEIKEVTNYLALKDPCEARTEINPTKEWIAKFRKGQELSKKMDCMHCHGSYHHAAPRLYAQKKSYLLHSLNMFSEDKRDAFFKMIQIAKSLDDEQKEDLSHYFNGMILMRDCVGM